jgi:hypothetical protein
MHIGGGGLLLQRLPQLVEQPRVLDVLKVISRSTICRPSSTRWCSQRGTDR